MVEWFRDPVWQFVGAVIALASVGLSVWFFILQRNKKALVYEVETYTPLVRVNKEAKDQIEIRFKGVPVANVYLLMMRVWNNGNASILPEDFVEPLGFRLAEVAEILTAEIVKTEPEALKPELQPNGSTLGVAPLLLNARDAFTVKLLVAVGSEQPVVQSYGQIVGLKEAVKFLLAGESEQPVVKSSGRIAGVKAVMRAEPYEELEELGHRPAMVLAASIIVVVMLLVISIFPSVVTSVFEKSAPGFLLAIMLFYALSVLSLVVSRVMARAKRYRPG